MYDFREIEMTDPAVAEAMKQEITRQKNAVELIASENFVSPAVMAAMGSPLTNKYAEGYPGHRYYGGCGCVDIVENLAIERAKELFGAEYVNVQPHAGSQANFAVYFGLLHVGDTIMGMSLAHGGHLTHGSPANLSGAYFHIVPYVVNEEGPSGPQRRAYAIIRGENGEPSGFVITLMLMSSIRDRNTKVLLIFLGVIILAIAGESLISAKVSKKVTESLMGFEPDVFSAMYKVRDDILESLNEGVIAVDKDSEVIFMNKAASEMISGDGKDDSPEDLGSKLLSGAIGKEEKEVSIPVNLQNDVDIIMDRHPITEDGRAVGAVGILHDRTEYTRLAEDLAGTRFLVDSMRANNHDFTNKLHVIMGIIQMEMYDEALNYIQNITIVQRETISKIMKRISCPALAALLIGKNARASELNIKFTFDEESSLDTDIHIPDEVLVTITGNLIDNAFDAMNGKGSDFTPGNLDKELKVGIYSKDGNLEIKVEDNGPGIKAEDLEHIFENGFSTKGDGRGIGLYQINSLTEAYGGSIDVRSQEGKGTSFRLEFKEGKKKNV